MDSIYLKLGVTEIDDQAAGVKSLWDRPYLDKNRVGIFGTSYGAVNTGSAVTDFAGLRNVSGQFNNLNPGLGNWGAVDGLFAHDAPPHQGAYLQQVTGPVDAHSLESVSTATVDGPTTTGTTVVNGRTLTYGYFDRTTTVTDALTTVTDGHHLVATSNQVDTTDTVTVTPMDAYTNQATGPASAPVLSTMKQPVP